MLVLLYGCTPWNLTKCLGGKKCLMGATSCFEQIQEAIFYKTAAVRPHTSHLIKHPSKMNKTCWTTLEKDKPISNILLLTATHEHTTVGWPEKKFTFIISVMPSRRFGKNWSPIGTDVKGICAMGMCWWWWWWWLYELKIYNKIKIEKKKTNKGSNLCNWLKVASPHVVVW